MKQRRRPTRKKRTSPSPTQRAVIPTIEESIESLRKHVMIFDKEDVTTDKHHLWSLKKLIVLRYYIYPFLDILRNNKFKKIHYVDLFAGTGLLKIEDKIMPGTPLVPLLTTKEIIKKKTTHYFDEYHISDIDGESIKLLEERINQVKEDLPTSIHVQKTPFDKAVEEIFSGTPPTNENWKNDAYLVVLDPFGFDIDWNHLTQILRSGAVDVIIIFHTRLASWNQNKDQSAEKLTKMYGDIDWVTCDSEDAFLEMYCKKIREIPSSWKSFKTKTLSVERQNGKYHIIFVSRSPGADSVFEDMQKKFEAVDMNVLQFVFDKKVIGDKGLDVWFNS